MSYLDQLVDRFGTVGDELTVGGIAISRLAHRAGGTPFFAYDRSHVRDRIDELRRQFPGVQLSYAVKANPMPAVVGHLGQTVDRFDVASAAELRVALDTGKSAEQISFAGPGKTNPELACAVASGTTIELESERELERVIAVGAELAVRPRVAVRVNPPFVVKGSAMRMGGGPQQFGIDAESVLAVLEAIGRADVEFIGFHLFAGSQNLNAEVLASTQRETIRLIADLAALAPGPVRYVNIGGGFGIPYFSNNRPLDLTHIGTQLVASIALGREAGLADAVFVIELGRFIVGEAGIYVTRVVDRKLSRGKTFLVVDGGLHHLLAASGNFGQVIRRNYPIVVGSRLSREHPVESVNIVGCSCTPLDMLGVDVDVAVADVGDLVVIFQAGAYGRTASPAGFLSHPEAAEILV